ncbi:flagellar filament capping protein FliD [Sutcliffiella sp. NC1]|uniref:flagellar filament capping protein FliD n=1 Tax=Sutcliffiella sp. NC1 TaxID=3004096 RepID=UPI0022DDDEE9|nr:flagellar filament capping protein FliD [Sutcliffiella sp. NC1]WBL14495.1 flagellar filament capping protein FliD [Sutcliffiella sp. NC1]
MRISGFASGMDIDQMVKDLMKAERIPLDRFYQRRTTIEWQRDAYREMNTMLANFRDLSRNLTLSTSLGAKTVSTSNTNIATATASSSAAFGSYKLENVTLASAATNISAGTISSDEQNKLDPTKSLWSQRDKVAALANVEGSDVWVENSFEQSAVSLSNKNSVRLSKGAINSETFPNTLTVSSSDFTRVNSLEELENGGQAFFVDTNTGQVTFSETFEEGDELQSFSYDHYSFNFSITTYDVNGTAKATPLEFDGTATLNQVISGINTSAAGVTALYDSQSDQIVFTRKETGNFNIEGPEMTFEGAFLTSVLQMDPSRETGGSDARFTINGLETSRKSNTFTMNGMTITLKSNTVGNESINLTVNANTDKAFDEVMNFVNTYNELIGEISGKVNEQKNRNYPPLTDEQRREMSDREIELWEEKARSGLLQNDSSLRSSLDQFRRELYNAVDGVDQSFNHLMKIGITTSRDFREGGKLIVDEGKLREALASNPDEVRKLFGQDGSTQAEKGLAQRLRTIADNTIKSIETKAGNQYRTNQQFSLGRELIDVEKRITDFERRLVGIENRYWSQFTAMEKALSQMNSQANYLYSQFMS